MNLRPFADSVEMSNGRQGFGKLAVGNHSGFSNLTELGRLLSNLISVSNPIEE